MIIGMIGLALVVWGVWRLFDAAAVSTGRRVDAGTEPSVGGLVLVLALAIGYVVVVIKLASAISHAISAG